MKRPTAIAGGIAVALVALGAVAVAFVWTPEIAPIDPSRQARLDPELVRKGTNLAALGDSNTCHTAPDGQAFAGGLPMPTPFGTIYPTNITPDPETGIGRWSEEAFRRAMREGVDREGRHLYPAFPLRPFQIGIGRGRRRPLCIPPDPQACACHGAGKRAAFPPEPAARAMRMLAASAQWDETAKLPIHDNLADVLVALPSRDLKILDNHQAAGPVVRTLEASYSRPYQSHGSIGPSCAVAQLLDGVLSVWTHTQGVFPDRAAIAEMLRLPPDEVRCIHVEGSGCYGHSGADDAAGDADLIAASMPGTPIRLQWMREQEQAWEPYGPAMVTKVSAGLDAMGEVADWRYEVWSNTHSMRPGSAGSLLPAQHVANPFPVPPPQPLPLPEGGGDRNAVPLYMPLRVSTVRPLGAYMNVFTIEGFMDELALAAKTDPVEFRLKHHGESDPSIPASQA